MRPGFVSLLLSTLAAACSALPSTGHDISPVQRALAEIIAADNAGDIERVMACYSPSPMLMPPNEDVVDGRDAVRARYELAFANFRFEFEGAAFETRVEGDLGWIRGETRGRLVSKGGGGDIAAHDKFLMTLERDGAGHWRIARLMWSPVGDH